MWRDARDPRDRDLVRRDRGRARRRATAQIHANVVASQAELHARLRRRRARDRLAPPPRARSRRCSREALDRRRRRRSTRSSASRSPSGPGLIGALLVGVSLREGDRLRPRPAARARSTTCTATSPRSTCEPLDLEPPFTCLLASGGHTLLLDGRATAAGTGVSVLGTTLDDAAGEAFDKGARLLGLPYPGGAAIDRARPRGRPGRLPLPGRARRRARLLVLGAEDRAPLRRPRPRPATSSSGAGPTWRRATSGRSCAPSSSGSRRPAASASRSSAASPPTRSCAPRCPGRSPRRSRSAPTTPR